jgi:hypothetical protein
VRGTLLIIIGVLAGLVIFVTSPSTTVACDFEPPPPPEQALDEATAVFAGEVRSIEQVDDDPGQQYIAATFDVDRSWKGVESSPVVVETHQDEATCGFPFEEGGTYIVYAYSEGTPLTTALYHRTNLLERADEDLDVLGSGTEVAEQNGDPAANDDDFNPGILVLVAVIISIIVATIMLLRQSKPGLPDNYDDGDDYDAGEDDPADHRR